jgi:PAS domain S-box-containing protein
MFPICWVLPAEKFYGRDRDPVRRFCATCSLGCGDPRRLCRHVARRLAEHPASQRGSRSPASGCGVGAHLDDQGERNLLELQASAGQYTRLDGEFARMQVGERHLGLVAQERKSYIANDLVCDQRTAHPEWAKKERLVALAEYPLLVEGRLIGVLALFTRQTLEPDSLEALASVADIVAQGAERKQNEEKLLAHQRQWEEAQPLARLGGWSWNTSTGAVTWSDEIYRIFGLDKDAFHPTHQAVLDLVHPNDRALFESSNKDCLAGRRPYDCEIRVVRPDGAVLTLHSRGQAIFDQTGQPLRMTGTVQDITERKQADEKLRESEERFRQLTENIGEVFWLADAELQSIIYVSPAYEAIWGRSCESLCAEPRGWLDAIHPEDRLRVLDARTIRTDAYELEYRIVRPDGAVRRVRNRAFPVNDAGGRVIRMAGVVEDVTERHQLEMQLRQAQKNGSDRSTGRRGGPRLQQSAVGHLRSQRVTGDTAAFGQTVARVHRRDPPGDRIRERLGPSAAGFQLPSDLGTQGFRFERRRGPSGENVMAAHRRAGALSHAAPTAY